MAYSTINMMGNVGVLGVSLEEAKRDLDYREDKHPYECWEIIPDEEVFDNEI